MKKLLFLFLALLLPVLIFLFLKSFGKNEFEVPVLFTDSVDVPVACNAYRYQAPYTINDSILHEIDWSKNDTLTIVIFEDDNTSNQHERRIQRQRVFTEFKDSKLKVVDIFKQERLVKIEQQDRRLVSVFFTSNQFDSLKNCVFLLSASNDAVIVDTHKRIRGQYNLTKREDADRMIMQEMNILFKRY